MRKQKPEKSNRFRTVSLRKPLSNSQEGEIKRITGSKAVFPGEKKKKHMKSEWQYVLSFPSQFANLIYPKLEGWGIQIR